MLLESVTSQLILIVYLLNVLMWYSHLPINAANEFEAKLPQDSVDLIYLCFPNNPTGAVATRKQLSRWVNYAQENNALILFDAAYEAFIQGPDLPHSIFEIKLDHHLQ